MVHGVSAGRSCHVWKSHERIANRLPRGLSVSARGGAVQSPPTAPQAMAPPIPTALHRKEQCVPAMCRLREVVFRQATSCCHDKHAIPNLRNPEVCCVDELPTDSIVRSAILGTLALSKALIVFLPTLPPPWSGRRITELAKHVVEVPPRVTVEEESTYILENCSLWSKRSKGTERLGEEVSAVRVASAVAPDAERLARNACSQEPHVPVVVSPSDAANVTRVHYTMQCRMPGEGVVLKGLTRVGIDLEHVQSREAGSLKANRETSRPREEVHVDRFEPASQSPTLHGEPTQGGREYSRKNLSPLSSVLVSKKNPYGLDLVNRSGTSAAALHYFQRATRLIYLESSLLQRLPELGPADELYLLALTPCELDSVRTLDLSWTEAFLLCLLDGRLDADGFHYHELTPVSPTVPNCRDKHVRGRYLTVP